MRHTLLLCFCLFMVFSCSESSLSDSFANDEIEFRKIKVDCDVKFEAGNALDIFGANFVFGFEPGWKGSFKLFVVFMNHHVQNHLLSLVSVMMNFQILIIGVAVSLTRYFYM